MKKIIIFIFMTRILAMSYDDYSYYYDDSYKNNTIDDSYYGGKSYSSYELEQQPDLDIDIYFETGDTLKKFIPIDITKKYKIKKYLYFRVRISAIISEDYKNRNINANISIPSGNKHKIEYIHGGFLNNSKGIYKIPIKTSYINSKYENNFIFRIYATDTCSIPIGLEFEEDAYKENNFKIIIEFEKTMMESTIDTINDTIKSFKSWF